jgi:glutamine amidotransferase
VITIVDYKLGNLGSVLNMLNYLGIKAEITSDLEKIGNATKIILSGVGSFDTAMENLEKMGLTNILNSKVRVDNIPVLGICLGMQIMTNRSEEGYKPGLGWIDAETVKFKGENLRIPHMMWNHARIKHESKLFKDFDEKAKFYFAHSYYLETNDPDPGIATTFYGKEFVSVIEKGNILGVQFHPEKSHKYGMKLLRNFAENY